MFYDTLHTRVFDVKKASASELAALHVFLNRIMAEQWPDDLPPSLDETVRRLRSVPPFVDLCTWAVWSADESKIVARAEIVTLDVGTNEHLAHFDIAVLPELRRQGIAKGLLGFVSQAAEEKSRRLLMTDTNSDVPAGEAFMTRIGAQAGLVEQINQLDLADLNRDLLDEWPARAQERAGGFELGLWEGPYPEEEIEAIAKMRDVMNTAPREELDVGILSPRRNGYGRSKPRWRSGRWSGGRCMPAMSSRASLPATPKSCGTPINLICFCRMIRPWIPGSAIGGWGAG